MGLSTAQATFGLLAHACTGGVVPRLMAGAAWSYAGYVRFAAAIPGQGGGPAPRLARFASRTWERVQREWLAAHRGAVGSPCIGTPASTALERPNDRGVLREGGYRERIAAVRQRHRERAFATCHFRGRASERHTHAPDVDQRVFARSGAARQTLASIWTTRATVRTRRTNSPRLEPRGAAHGGCSARRRLRPTAARTSPKNSVMPASSNAAQPHIRKPNKKRMLSYSAMASS
jgi:hypothetical protein